VGTYLYGLNLWFSDGDKIGRKEDFGPRFEARLTLKVKRYRG
jgi:hypothetical protein